MSIWGRVQRNTELHKAAFSAGGLTFVDWKTRNGHRKSFVSSTTIIRACERLSGNARAQETCSCTITKKTSGQKSLGHQELRWFPSESSLCSGSNSDGSDVCGISRAKGFIVWRNGILGRNRSFFSYVPETPELCQVAFLLLKISHRRRPT